MEIKLKNGRIDIRIINSSTLSLTHNVDTIQVKKGKYGKIEQLIFSDDVSVILGEAINVEKNKNIHKYSVRGIIRESNTSYKIISTIRNKSSIFILPLIANNKKKPFFFYDSYFYNSYLRMSEYDTYNDGGYIFLKYRFFDSDHFYAMERDIMALPQYIKTVQPDKDFTIYIFKIPEQFKKDVKLFMLGRYSRVSTTAKARIILFHEVRTTDKIGQILYKDKELRKRIEEDLGCDVPEEIDLLTKPQMEQETII
jgi:hypothetical protein